MIQQKREVEERESTRGKIEERRAKMTRRKNLDDSESVSQ